MTRPDGEPAVHEPDGAYDESGVWLPRSNRDQSCAFCNSEPSWVHPLAPKRVRYRQYGKGHTLPGFWTVCDRCERSVVDGSDEKLVETMKNNDMWTWTTEEDVREVIRQALGVFRLSDLGGRRLPN